MSDPSSPKFHPLSIEGKRTRYENLKDAMVAFGLHDGSAQRVVEMWAGVFAASYADARGIASEHSNSTFDGLLQAGFVKLWIPQSAAYLGIGEQMIVLNPQRYYNNEPLAAKVFKNRLEQLELFRNTSATGTHFMSRPGCVHYVPGCEPVATRSPEGRGRRFMEQPPCPTCFTVLPATGICGYCAD
jgi:hypothetical protein